jgi:MFS family permease
MPCGTGLCDPDGHIPAAQGQDLGLSQAAFGLGAGTAFFLGYFLLEVPSNVILHKIGARLWIVRMISWGLISGATAFVVGEWSFYLVRFLLGLAEAGFFPGMILFFTYWFPPIHRGRITAGFMTAIPISIALGGPISTSLLELHGMLGLCACRFRAARCNRHADCCAGATPARTARRPGQPGRITSADWPGGIPARPPLRTR